MAREIMVEIGPDGQIKIEAIGFKGAACEKATAELEKALGVTTKKTKKPEFFQQNQTGQQMGH